jgi:hypothetical protein
MVRTVRKRIIAVAMSVTALVVGAGSAAAAPSAMAFGLRGHAHHGYIMQQQHNQVLL